MHALAILRSCLAGALLFAVGCSWLVPSEPLRSVRAGIPLPDYVEIPVDFAHHWDREKGHHLSGASVLDVDGDGRFEIFVGGGEGQPDALLSYRDGRLVDRGQGFGLSSERATYGSAALDLDGDGDVDLLVARNDGLTFYRRLGDHFEGEHVPVELPENSVPLAVSVADVDRDGDPDLYLSVFVDYPHFVSATFNVPDHAKGNRLLRNDGDGHFSDITSEATATLQNTFTSAFVDLDGDGLQDLVVAQNTGQAEILRNRGGGDFERVPLATGFGFWMGVAVGDADSDGDPDLLFTNVGDSFPGFLAHGDLGDDQPFALGWLLLRNDGDFHFSDVTQEAGLAGMGFAWGAAFEDVNLDGQLDILAAQNYVKWPVHRLFKFPGKVLLGAPGGPSYDPAPVAADPAWGNAPLLADLDGDGRLDLFWLNDDGPSRAYLNRSRGNSVVVAFDDSFHDLGARARLEGAPARYARELVSGAGLGSDSAPWLVFGIGEAEHVTRLVVEWPDGHSLAIDDPPLNRPIAVR